MHRHKEYIYNDFLGKPLIIMGDPEKFGIKNMLPNNKKYNPWHFVHCRQIVSFCYDKFSVKNFHSFRYINSFSKAFSLLDYSEHHSQAYEKKKKNSHNGFYNQDINLKLICSFDFIQLHVHKVMSDLMNF